MARLVVSRVMPHRIDDVWAAVSTLERHAEWMADAEMIEFLGETRRGEGTEMRVLTKVGLFSTNDVIRVEGWVPPRTIEVSHRGLVTGSGKFDLDPVPGGTRFTWMEELRFPWYLGGEVTARLASPILRRIWRGNLERFASSLG
jgi:uncharacterized protein YndB with AHSA1/START domain